jgi:hypothetical protein
MHFTKAFFACVLAASSSGAQSVLGEPIHTPYLGTYTCAMMGMGGMVMPMGSFTLGNHGTDNFYTTNPGDGTEWKITYYDGDHTLIFEGNMSRFIGMYRGNLDGAEVIELWGMNPFGNRVRMATCTLR